ncbi:MAG: hypothetical protein ACRD82_09950 [Blastocatellia bacterium]
MELLKTASIQMLAPGVKSDWPKMEVPGAIVYVVPLKLMEPAVVTVAGLKDCTTPQIAVAVSAAAGEAFHLATATRQSVKQSVSIVVFIRIELSP